MSAALSTYRIAVLSDTHDQFPEGLAERLGAADEIWHLGDVCEPAALVELEQLGRPLRVVRGNCDWWDPWPLELRFERCGLNFLLTHIPPARVAYGVHVVVHGHTHVPRDELRHGVRWLSPGAVTRPRHGTPSGFAWLTLASTGVLRWQWVPL